MKILSLLLIVLLVSCHKYDVPVTFNIKGQVQTTNGVTVFDTEGYVCVDLTVYRKGNYQTEKTCGPKSRSSVDGLIYADLFPQVKENIWIWQGDDSIKIVDYQIYLRTNGKIIRGEFPNGKPGLDEIINEIDETLVYFSVDRMGYNGDGFYDVEYLYNYDGDTVTFNIPGVHPLLGEKISVRVSGVQTAEIITDDFCEKEAALFAKDEVKLLLESATRIDLYNMERGKYFRIVADVILTFDDDTVISLGEFILENYLGVFYDGQTKPEVDWCSFPKSIF